MQKLVTIRYVAFDHSNELKKCFAGFSRFLTNFIFRRKRFFPYKVLLKCLNFLLSMRIQTILLVNICRISNLSIHFIYKKIVLEMERTIQIEWVQNNELYLRDVFLSYHLNWIVLQTFVLFDINFTNQYYEYSKIAK